MSYPRIRARILPIKINPPKPIATDLLKQVLSDADRTGSSSRPGYGNGQINRKELASYSKNLDKQLRHRQITRQEWSQKKQAVTLLQDNFNAIGSATGGRNPDGQSRLSNRDIDKVASLDGNGASLSAIDLKRQVTGYAYRGGAFNQLR